MKKDDVNPIAAACLTLAAMCTPLMAYAYANLDVTRKQAVLGFLILLALLCLAYFFQEYGGKIWGKIKSPTGVRRHRRGKG